MNVALKKKIWLMSRTNYPNKTLIQNSERTEICVLLRYYAARKFLTDVSGQLIGPIFMGQEIQKFVLDGTDTLSQNVSKEVPLYAA